MPENDHFAARGESILVVDDEPDVRKLVVAMLTNRGYKVLTAGKGEDAVTIFRKNQPFDLLLADVVSPGMSGPMLADRLVEIQPGLKVLFMTGFDDSHVVQRYVVEKGHALIVKPFTPEQMGRKVREVLDSPKSTAAATEPL